MVSKLDQSVGEVIEALNNRKMLENSIVLFMSDNGAPTEGFLQNYGSNYPLRGIKNSPWEGGVRGVAAIWSPLIKNRKRVSNQLISVVDWLPTLLSIVGDANIPKIDGRNIWPTLESDKLNLRQEVLINIDDINGYSAIRRGNFKYVNGETPLRFTWIGDSGKSPDENRPSYDPEKVLYSKAGIAFAETIKQISKQKVNQLQVDITRESILTSNKILQLRQQAEVHCNVTEQEKIPCDPMIFPCLFNIKDDPCEMINIIEQKPFVAASLEMTLLKYRLTMVPPSNKEMDFQANPIHWNNTWTYWQESQPSLIKVFTCTYSNMYIALIVFILFVSIGISLGFKLYYSKKQKLK
ncbi:uncharacterized protein LOC105832676 [Monomorium pharaonis]|uniref:uncharacterized protein LOC105832676 n=1 Tax=Monomorium pharaonis TaxID=307658 RepID=UPI00102E1DC3|nr:uncharacterized protein LOC105832676 [Monomorium pharaonis]